MRNGIATLLGVALFASVTWVALSPASAQHSCTRNVSVTHGGSVSNHSGGYVDADVKQACANGIRSWAYFPPYVSAVREGAWVKSGNHSVRTVSNTNRPTTGGYDVGHRNGFVRRVCTFGCSLWRQLKLQLGDLRQK